MAIEQFPYRRSDAVLWDGLMCPAMGFFLCDLGEFAEDILLGPHRFNAQKHVGISRKIADAQRRNSRQELPRPR
jgi:hypothetical protein